MMHKNGVTLMTLSITIVVLAILAGVVTINAAGIIRKSTLAKFAEEIELIEDKIQEYYIAEGVLPVLSNSEYTVDQLLELNSSNELRQEINKNNDEESKFYLINYDLLKLKISKRGIEATPEDIYVVSSATNTVYYVKGAKIGNEVYFSLVYISNTNKINQSN